MKSLIFGFAVAATAVTTPALAGTMPITGSMTANYFTATAGGSGDFQTYCCSDVRSNLVTTTLGPNGLPVYNTASVGPQAITGYDALTKELQWWTPGVTNGGDTIVSTGSALVAFPYSNAAFSLPTEVGQATPPAFRRCIFRRASTSAERITLPSV